MIDEAIADAMALSVMYFFMDKWLWTIILRVWAKTERPPKEMIPVISGSFSAGGRSIGARNSTAAVISRQPVRTARINGGNMGILRIKAAAAAAARIYQQIRTTVSKVS